MPNCQFCPREAVARAWLRRWPAAAVAGSETTMGPRWAGGRAPRDVRVWLCGEHLRARPRDGRRLEQGGWVYG